MNGTNAKDFFVQPTIFSEVKPEMKIAQEEIVGPVLSVMNEVQRPGLGGSYCERYDIRIGFCGLDSRYPTGSSNRAPNQSRLGLDQHVQRFRFGDAVRWLQTK